MPHLPLGSRGLELAQMGGQTWAAGATRVLGLAGRLTTGTGPGAGVPGQLGHLGQRGVFSRPGSGSCE